uniref:Intraflagellar transport protein 80 n=1 Tax=Timema tahoe TaxID=61484 RepID=A0A7R9FDZ8_9NEOP|nr:unnamed protein product [Timema tahoe]
MQPETLNLASISISNDTIAVRDQLDSKTVHLFEVGSARSLVDLPSLHHWVGVVEVTLNQAGSALERQIAVVDRNRDLYLALVRGSLHKKLRKLAPMIQSLCWNTDTNILATVQDTNLTVWYYPMVLYADSRLLKKTAHIKDSRHVLEFNIEFGKSPTVMSFVGNHLRVRRMDGSLVNSVISPYPTVLHGYTSASRWDDALRMCRFVRDHTLWACLAAMAVYGRELETAEEAYAAIDEVDKVFYLQNVKKIPIRAAQLAEMALLSGNVSEAENLLLQNGFVFRAIMTNLNLHKWNRQVELDPEKINEKVEQEYERERENG